MSERPRHLLLDPLVEWSESAHGGFNLVHHGGLRAAVAPDDEGLLQLLEELRTPKEAQEIFEIYGEEAASLVLDGLAEHGFLLEDVQPITEQSMQELRHETEARHAARARGALTHELRPGDDARAMAEAIVRDTPRPELVLRCARLADHTTFFVELAALRRDGSLQAHEIRVETEDASDAGAALDALFAAGARLLLLREAPRAVLAAALAAHVEVLAIDRGGSWLLDRSSREARAARIEAQRLGGLRLELDLPALLEGAGELEQRRREIVAALAELEDRIGDLEVAGLPGDPVISGQRRWVEHLGTGPELRALRRVFLHARVERLRNREDAKYSWPQRLEAEDAWVRPEDDLIPNHPELLGLFPGAIVVESCGGHGRISRRLARYTAPGGTMICLDRDAGVLDRARTLRAQAGAWNVQLRRALGERLPLADASADAAILERAQSLVIGGNAGAITRELVRVVKPGGRIVISFWLCRLLPEDLSQPVLHRPDLVQQIDAAVSIEGLEQVDRRFWASSERRAGLPVAWFSDAQLPRLLDPLRNRRYGPTPLCADLYLTVIARRI